MPKSWLESSSSGNAACLKSLDWDPGSVAIGSVTTAKSVHFLFHPLQNEDASDSIYFTRWQEGWNEKLHVKNTMGSQWLLAFSLLLSHFLSCMLFIANTVMVWNGQIISHLPPKLGQSHCVKASVAQEVMFIFKVYFEPCPPPHTHSPSLAPLFFSFLRNTQDPHFTPKRVNALVFFSSFNKTHLIHSSEPSVTRSYLPRERTCILAGALDRYNSSRKEKNSKGTGSGAVTHWCMSPLSGKLFSSQTSDELLLIF